MEILHKVKDKLLMLEPINSMLYYGFGNDNYVFVKGRVLEDEKVKRQWSAREVSCKEQVKEDWHC